MRIPRIQTGLVLALAVACLASPAPAQLQPAFGRPLPGLTPDELARFEAGKTAFDFVFDEAGGLGPIFNENSCGSCHNDPVTGGTGNVTVTRFGFLEKGEPFDPLADLGGSLLQDEAISDSCAEMVPPEATVVINRVTTLALGIGLIEGIPDSDLEALEGPGQIHWVQPLEDPFGPLRAGRFGWKAQVATVFSFSGDATLNEMGITNPLVPDENAPNGDLALLALCDLVPDPEDDGTFIQEVTDFQRFSAGPPQTPRSGMTGEQVFIDIGCADCHVATPFVTGPAPEAALSGVTIKPYSDFLLHDMGGLGDQIVQGDAEGTQMRTPPLWGLLFRDPLIHDARVTGGTFSTRITDAINFHGGEAIDSVMNFGNLDATETAQLMAFLESLGRGEYDADANIVITEDDYRSFRDCFTGPGDFYTPDDFCSIHDIDQDGDVDLDDFAPFLGVYIGTQDDCDGNGEIDLIDFLTGDAQDCNDNLVPDSCDIDSGTSLDVNGNGVPDECETFIRSDCNADGAIDIADAVRVLDGLFGGDPVGCVLACDANADGALDIADAVYSLNHQFAMGPEPEAPFPDCGIDLTPAAGLSCEEYAACP